MRKKILLFCVSLCLLTVVAKSAPKRILFIGNSYTYVNDLPNVLKSLALSFGDSVIVDNYTPGGYTFNMHSTDASTLSKIQLGNWDYVILQAQSQEPSFSPAQVQTNTYPFATILDSLINANNLCAETLFYMSWGRKNGDASNCASYPPICTYAGMQQRLRESYLEMSMDNQASTSPVGVAWKTCRDNYPSIELYNPDESHPSINGTYLAACTFYSSIFHKSSVGSNYYITGMNATDASALQNVASNTVLDSLENWQQYGDIPLAKFSSTQIADSIQFSNQSMRYISLQWDFGDGTFSNQTNPKHHYAAVGNYTVVLKVSNGCGKQDILTKTVTYNTPSQMNTSALPKIEVWLVGKVLQIRNANGYWFTLMDSNGNKVIEQKVNGNQTEISLQHLSNGTYYTRLVCKGKPTQKERILIKD